MKKYFFPLLASVALLGCLGLEDVNRLFEKKQTAIVADKSEYRMGETIKITATAADRKYVLVGAVPFAFYKYSFSSDKWSRLDVSLGPTPRLICNGGKAEMFAEVKQEREICRQLETLQYFWYGSSWRTKRVSCGGAMIDEVAPANETGQIRVELALYSDSGCTILNSTISSEFRIS